MGCAITGIGMGQAPAEEQAAPSPARGRRRQAADRRRRRRRPRAAASCSRTQGCDACHSIAAVGAEGKLGPRLDTLDDDADDIVEGITEPREDTADGFPENLMPTDYAQRMGDADVQALAAFVAAASGADG